MRRRSGAWALLALLLVPGATAAWLQQGGDAARLGTSDGPTPRLDDIALETRVPGVRAFGAPPVVLGRDVYVLTTNASVAKYALSLTPEQAAAENKSPNALWRVNVDTAVVERVRDFDQPVHGLASDGERLFVSHVDGVDALYPDGAGAWAWAAPRIYAAATHVAAWCVAPAVADGAVYLLCETWREPVEGTFDGELYVVKLDAASGTRHWLWWQFAGAGALEAPDALVTRGRVGLNKWGSALDLSVVGPFVFVTSFSVAAVLATSEPKAERAGGAGEFHLEVLDAELGQLRWAEQSKSNEKMASFLASCEVPHQVSAVVGTPTAVYYKMDEELHAVNPARGNVRWNMSARTIDADLSGDQGSALALAEDLLVVPSAQSVQVVDVDTRAALWEWSLVASGLDRIWMRGGTLVGNDTLYLVSARLTIEPQPAGSIPLCIPLFTAQSIHAFDLRSGRELWTLDREQDFPFRHGVYSGNGAARLAAGDGFLVWVGLDGRVLVVGKTGASPALHLPLAPNDAYAPVGAPIQLDLAGSSAVERITGYRVDWGDGAVLDWQPSSLVTHAYAAPCDCTARFQLRTSDNRTASELFTFHVGRAPPVDPDLVQPAAAPPPAPTLLQQTGDTLRGPVGWTLLAALLLLALLALLARHHRRRTRLAREMAAAERAFHAAQTDATAAQAVLAERRTHASRLLLRRKIDTREHAALVGHIAALESTLGPRTAMPPVAEIAPGVVLHGKYKVVRVLGEGAYGRAFLAEDTLVARQVVLKLLRETLTEESLREARAIGAIRHPNVVTLFDVTRLGNHPLLVMEYAEGGSLKDRIARGPVSAGEFRALAVGLLDALGAVHEAGAVHRDVKPSNVLLSGRGEVKLADFGIAKAVAADQTMGDPTLSGAVGTLRYMSPEQARGRRVTIRSDLYSAGVTLFEAWTGRPFVEPRAGETAPEMQVRIASTAPFDREIGPSALRAWFATALAPDAESRFGSTREMREALEAAWTLAV